MRMERDGSCVTLEKPGTEENSQTIDEMVVSSRSPFPASSHKKTKSLSFTNGISHKISPVLFTEELETPRIIPRIKSTTA